MNWIEVAVSTTTLGIEPVAGILIMNGVTGYAVEDSNDFEEFLNGKEVYWDYIEESLLERRNCETRVIFYIPDDATGAEQLEVIRSCISRLKADDNEQKLGRLEVELSNIAEEDWANNWKKYFKPIEVGQRLIVKPTWEILPASNDRTIVEIDPSSSFGTGSHTTTKLCLEYIDLIDKALSSTNYEMLDVGCGSGILGIAASKLADCQVTAIDIEENSIRVAEENFQTNKIASSKYQLLLGSITDDKELFEIVASKRYKLLAANIVADVLIMMAPLFRQLLDEDGFAVISGIIAERADEVESFFVSTGFAVVDKKTNDGWTAIVLKHPKSRADITR